MPKKPDEIKKGLECGSKNAVTRDCNACPYTVDRILWNCQFVCMRDALALIQQLEFQNGELLKTVEMLKAEIEEYEQYADKCCYESRCNAELNKLEALCKQLRDENEQLEAERDALIGQARENDICVLCKHKDVPCDAEPCVSCCAGGLRFEWRGVQKEDNDDNAV